MSSYGILYTNYTSVWQNSESIQSRLGSLEPHQGWLFGHTYLSCYVYTAEKHKPQDFPKGSDQREQTTHVGVCSPAARSTGVSNSLGTPSMSPSSPSFARGTPSRSGSARGSPSRSSIYGYGSQEFIQGGRGQFGSMVPPKSTPPPPKKKFEAYDFPPPFPLL